MPASGPLPLTERLPTELLERVFLFTSTQDILRLASVNRAWRAIVQNSPSIQYKIDLFAVGLERNPQTERSLADCRIALAAYRRRWKTLDPAEQWEKALDMPGFPDIIAIGGTYGLLGKDYVKFFILGSVSRGVPGREWDVPLKNYTGYVFAFYPRANIMAVAENSMAWTWRVHLSTMSDGEPHPAARTAVLSYTFPLDSGAFTKTIDISITNSRLALMRGISSENRGQVTVWDWTTGQILLELDNEFHRSAKFVDNYLLAFVVAPYQHDSPPRLVLLNTEQTTTADTTPMQTTFGLGPLKYPGLGAAFLHLESGGYEPSHDEVSFAPFYPDASQRVLAIEFCSRGTTCVVKTEVLLKLAREQGATDIEWEQWKAHAFEVQPGNLVARWVSGHRLFCVSPSGSGGEATRIDVYDFSARAPGRESETTDRGRRVRPSAQGYPSWDGSVISGEGTCDTLALLRDPKGDEDQGTLYWWNF